MNKVFNTGFETSLRLALLLYVVKEPLGLDEICAMDFVATYNGGFSEDHESVNGDNRFMFSEYATRRELSEAALKELVLRGIVIPFGSSRGFAYLLTPQGVEFASQLGSAYATEYKEGALFARSYVGDMGLDAVISEINRNAV